MANLKSLEINGVDIIDIFYPVGCLFYTTNNNFNPNNIFENTTWEKIEGRFIVGTDKSDSDFTSMKTGGEKTHTLTINEMPVHNHGVAGKTSGSEAQGYSLYPGSGGFDNRALVSSAVADKGRMTRLQIDREGVNHTTTYLHIIAQIFGIELLKSIESSFHKFNERRNLNWHKSKI